MNKFFVIKCKTKQDFDVLKSSISKYSLSALSFHPTHVRIHTIEQQLLIACSFERSDTGGFEKRYTYTAPGLFFAFDGLPLNENIDPKKNWARQVNDIWRSDANALNDIFGTWAGVRVTDKGLRVFSDFTGMTPVFYAQTDRYLAISTRQSLISHCVLDSVRDIQSVGWLIAQSNLFGQDMPHLGVKHLPPQYTLMASSKPGDLNFKLIEREIYTPNVNFHGGVGFSEPELDDALHAIIQQANAIAALPLEGFKLDITGGLDSRLVLALALSSNMRGKISHLQTSGVENGFEIQVGRHIAETVSLKHVAKIKKTEVNNQKSLSAESVLNRIRASNFRYDGSLCLSDAAVPPSKNSTLTITGSAGEIYRRHCKPHMKLHIDSHSQFMETYKDYHQITDPLDMMHSEVSDNYRLRLQKLAKGFVDDGVEFNDVSDVFFMRYRLPLWNGVIGNNIFGNVQVYPLANYALGKLAFTKGYKNRINDRIHFELMAKLSPELVSQPFLGFTWPIEFHARADELGIQLPTESYKTVGKAALAQRNPSMAAVSEGGMDVCREYLMSFPNSELWSVLSKKSVQRALQLNQRHSLVCMKSIFAAIGAISFLEKDMQYAKCGTKVPFVRDGAIAKQLFPC